MVDFVKYDEFFLNNSWKWLNDDEIKMLTNTPNFSREQQKEWFLSLTKKKNYYIKGMLFEGKRIGVVGLKNISLIEGEYWGYIGEKEYWGKGIGRQMINYILGVAKAKNLQKLYLKVIDKNIRAISVYNTMGFKVVKDKCTIDLVYMEYEF